MKTSLYICATLTALAITLYSTFRVHAGSEPSPTPSPTTPDTPSDTTPSKTFKMGASVPSAALFSSSDFSRRALRQGPPFSVRLESRERNPNTGGIEQSSQAYSVSFEPFGFSGISANDFIVFGYGRGSTPVFEKWVLPHDLGTYYSDRPLPGTPVGQPVLAGTTVVGIQGAYTSPSKRDALQPFPTRTEVYRGHAVGVVSCWGVDPEGRFILSISNASKELYRVFINEELEPSLVADETDLPVLGTASIISPVRHSTMGHGWQISGTELNGYLWDANYDGVFEVIECLTHAESELAYPYSSMESY